MTNNARTTQASSGTKSIMAYYAKDAGTFIASGMNDEVMCGSSYAEAVAAIKSSLNEAFNPDKSEILDSMAEGFALELALVLERGLMTTRAYTLPAGYFSAVKVTK